MAAAFFACFPPVPPTEKAKGPEGISVRVFKMKSPIRKGLDCPLKILIKRRARSAGRSRPSYSGRSEVTRTPGILLPKQARYQLRYTPIRYVSLCVVKRSFYYRIDKTICQPNQRFGVGIRQGVGLQYKLDSKEGK